MSEPSSTTEQPRMRRSIAATGPAVNNSAVNNSTVNNSTMNNSTLNNSTLNNSAVFDSLDSQSIEANSAAPMLPVQTIKSRKLPTLLTARGLVLILLAAYLALGPSAQQSDVIATILAVTILVFLVLAMMVSVLVGSRFRNALVAEVTSDTDGLTAGEPTQLFVRLTNLSIPPLFTLSLHVRFAHPILPDVWHHLVGLGSDSLGNQSSVRIIGQSIVFPHRGRWRVEGVALRFGDRLGLTHIDWELGAEQRAKTSDIILGEFVVSPATHHQESLPVLTSSTRPGDDWSDIQNQHGDPFDLKRYQPGDGLRRIVWKLYAKSGELMARHPEPACTPEGTVVIFTLANSAEDNVAATTVNYLRQLSNLEIIGLSAVEGATNLNISTNIPACEAALIDNVWNADQATPQETQSLLAAFVAGVRSKLGDSTLSRIIIFVSARRLSTDAGLDALLALGGILEQLSISPVFFVCNGELLQSGTEDLSAQGPGIWRHLIEPPLDGQTPPTNVHSRLRGRFIAGCAAKGWQVEICGADGGSGW